MKRLWLFQVQSEVDSDAVAHETKLCGFTAALHPNSRVGGRTGHLPGDPLVFVVVRHEYPATGYGAFVGRVAVCNGFFCSR